LLDEQADVNARAQAAVKLIGALRHTMEEDADTLVSNRSGGVRVVPGSVVLGAHVGTELEGLAEVTMQLVELAWLRQDLWPLSPSLRGPRSGR
jgi:hypothetical protein